MLSKKKFLLPLLAIPLLFSCNKPKIPKEPCTVIKESSMLEVKPQAEMDCVTNNDLSFYVEVKFNGSPLDCIGANDDFTSEGYFFTTSDEYPTYSRVKDPHVTINGESSVLTFYVCHYVNDGESESIHVSIKQQIVVKNSKALKPWVLWTVGGVVVIACVAMVYFTRRYKEKHG